MYIQYLGLHSGPVTAGVLRGDRARFQLFGDTVNTAARIERCVHTLAMHVSYKLGYLTLFLLFNSHGHPNRIHLSETTANLLRLAGKGNWLVPRADKVNAKGKGVLQTYWLIRGEKRLGSVLSGNDAMDSTDIKNAAEARKERLVEWICDLIEEHLDLVLIHYNTQPTIFCTGSDMSYKRQEGKTFLDETEDVITMATFDAKKMETKSKNVTTLNDAIRFQLRQYVKKIASHYNNNPFHNFEHACHVSMSVSKVLKRIISPDVDFDKSKGSLEAHLHGYTYGITSDPLAVLAIIISALIHDVDHQGISNMQLMKEQPNLATTFRMQSVAEQNSLEIAWNLLMEDDYKELRVAMFRTKDDMMRFRQILINVVLATDIFDKGLNDARKIRWQKAFNDNDIPQQELYSLRATIVIEHIIQASDVAHTMQHWYVYQKWNKRLFLEMTQAYKKGRMGSDPATFWYQGELGFFDNYIIPLAKKLKECGVFGVSSDEFLNYAEQNRCEWAERGQEIVSDLVHEVEDKNEEHEEEMIIFGEDTEDYNNHEEESINYEF
jgi:3'5'-cyclic nucleotide phosphodiesterase/Adenylate and Guanylate cyclase catalytic domain